MLEINDALKVFKVSTNPEDDRVAINHLNLEIKEGDFVEITYTTYFDTKHSHEYKNFTKIERI